ncbi:MAG: hypothetical protein WD273_12270 [Trueperaceae bacterium]
MSRVDASGTIPQQLPGPNDLLILPKAIEPAAEVFIKEGYVAVVSDNPQLHISHFGKYPHLTPWIDSDGHVVLLPTTPYPIRYVLVSWLHGEQIGILLWPDQYYSTISAGAITEIAAAGVPVAVWEASTRDDLTSVLTKGYKRLNI